jgi:threonine dehydratase
LRVGGATYDDAFDASMDFAASTGARYLHPYDDPLTAAGQGTLALELLEELPELGTVVVPVGGGGLVASVAVVVKALSPGVRVVGVQPEASPSLRESLRQGHAIHRYPAAPTLADGISGGIGDIAFAHRGLIDEVVTVSEAEIADAIAALVAWDQVVAEGAGAVAAAALLSGRVQGLGRPVAVVVSGGNIDAGELARLLHGRA